MKDEIIFLVEESLEGGFEAKALGYSIFTQAETFEELKKAVKDSIRCHFEEDSMPRIIRLHQVKEEVLSI
ncbi:2-oxoisovalerate dehydrogenase [Acidobacteriota bacterium]